MRARYYDPATEQFISRDPMEGVSGQPYAYSWGNPTNFGDPTGPGRRWV
jgi:RHS repeat-associated protein